ncbi:MAG: hypothetical protein R3F11_09000 [Verrucomicrobiales bacterium]
MTPFVPIPRSFFASAKWSAAAGEFTEREAFIDLCQRAAFTPGKLGFGSSSPDLQIGDQKGPIRFLVNSEVDSLEGGPVPEEVGAGGACQTENLRRDNNDPYH